MTVWSEKGEKEEIIEWFPFIFSPPSNEDVIRVGEFVLQVRYSKTHRKQIHAAAGPRFG